MSKQLLVLQEHDVAIDDLRRRLGVLPERAALHALNERRHTAEAEIGRLTGELEKLSGEEAAIEESLAVVEKRAAALDDTLRAPGSATRDAQAIIHAIEQLKAQAGELEESGLALLEQRDALLAEQAENQRVLEEVATEAPKLLDALHAAEGDAGREVATLEAERAAAAAEVDAALLATYERLRERLGGVAVARVQGGVCGGCHLSLSAADIDRFNKLAPGGYATCEDCSRLLIRE
jgi:predicted  nucleic acid-binding Zn-ribbon protein